MNILDTAKKFMTGSKNSSSPEVSANTKKAPTKKVPQVKRSTVPKLTIYFPHHNEPQFKFDNWEKTPPPLASLETMTHKLFIAHHRELVAIRHADKVAKHNAKDAATT